MSRDNIPKSGKCVDEATPLAVKEIGSFPFDPNVTVIMRLGTVQGMDQVRMIAGK